VAGYRESAKTVASILVRNPVRSGIVGFSVRSTPESVVDTADTAISRKRENRFLAFDRLDLRLRAVRMLRTLRNRPETRAGCLKKRVLAFSLSILSPKTG
jgi:hypothetical protein